MMATAATTTAAKPPSQEAMSRAAFRSAVIGTVNVLLIVLAIRLILLVAVGGAVALTFLAMQTPDLWRVVAAAVYAITIVCPLIWLSGRR